MVLGFRGFPRELEEAQEGFQEAHKELQSFKKKDLKMDSKINIFWANFEVIFGSILGPKIVLKGGQKCD